jgi:hypothetical protein
MRVGEVVRLKVKHMISVVASPLDDLSKLPKSRKKEPAPS